MSFKGVAGQVYGLDPDSRVLSNPWLDHAFVGRGEKMPMFADGQFDIVICDNVLEHLREPVAFFCEVRRVLKRGGWFLAKTPNRYHYVPLLAQLTPLWFHRFATRLRGRARNDTFSTFYRANTPRKLRTLAHQAGLKLIAINSYEARPEYLRWNALAYLPGILYERLVNWLRFDAAKVTIISIFQA